MSNMASSPQTPTRRRRPTVVANIDLSYPSPSPSPYNEPNSARFSHSRKSSLNTPITPHRHSLNDMNGNISMSGDFVSPTGGANGLGSLADELAGAWDDEDDEGEMYEFGEQPPMDDRRSFPTDEAEAQETENEHTRDSGIDVAASPALAPSTSLQLSPPKDQVQLKHQRHNSQYDGSDYGGDSDLEPTSGISPALEARLATIEGLARRGSGSHGGETDNVVERIVDRLKDLGGQAGVEGGATRLITAHTALSVHLARQTRTLHSLTFPLLSPLSLPPDPDIIADLLPMLATAIEIMPQPTEAALASLSNLSTVTSELITALNYLSDTLHMSRQTTTTATRRLRSARELVTEMRRENEVMEEGVRWIEKGDWQDRLGRRECGGVCRDVVGGFEEVCNGWKEKLFSGSEAPIGTAA